MAEQGGETDPMAAAGAAEAQEKKRKKNKKKPQDVSLYELLEVNWDATPEEIKKAYRRRALKLHPDKGGDPAQFNAMKRAYDILSDESKRTTYDTYGLEMLKVMEGEAGPEVFVMLMLKQKRFRAMILCMATFLIGFFILVPVLHAVKWDGASWSWAIVFIPVWLVLALTYARQILSMFSTPSPEDGEEEAPSERPPINKVEFVIVTLLFCCAVIFLAFLSARLDYTTAWSWFTVIIPWLLFEILLCIQRIMGAREAVVVMQKDIEAMKQYAQNTVEEAKSGLETGDVDAAIKIHEAEDVIRNCDEELKSLGVSKLYLSTAMFWPIMRFITAFLLAGRADLSYTGSWFITAIPFIVGTVVYPCLDSFRASTDPETANETGKGFCSGFVQYCFCLLIWLLAMGKLDNFEIYSAFAIWGPYFVIMGLLFLNMLLFLCINPEDMLQQDQAKEEAKAEAKEDVDVEAGNGSSDTTQQQTSAEAAPNVIILT